VCERKRKEEHEQREKEITYRCCVCVLLCFIKPILGNRYGPGVIH